MYKVAGSNLFGQWLEDDRLISDFRVIFRSDKNINSVELKLSELVLINWSYNVLQKDKTTFYLVGDYNGVENQIIKLDLPEECMSPDSKCDLTMVGNDYNLTLVDKQSNILWIIDLQKENNVKKINLCIETPLENSSKKARRDCHILKVAVTNNSLLCLTTDGRVYNGILPSLMDTSHCVGQACDIRCGYEHFMLLTDAGRVYTWGNGRRLQLGHGTLDNLESPTEVEALAGIKIVKISAGGWHCLALSEFGDLYTWGWNDTGQLGMQPSDTKGVLNKGGLKSYPLPTLVDFMDENGKEVDIDVKDIGCGSRHSAIILHDNSVWTTGYNKYGQLGFPPETHPNINFFKRAYQCKSETVVECGHWSTILINKVCNL